MSVGRTVRSIFEALTKMYFSRTFEKIVLSDRLYLSYPKIEITLLSDLGGEIQSTKLSVDEARQVLRSIKHACDLNDVVEIKVDELTWTTDARLRSEDPNRIILKFNGPYGSTRTSARREDLTAAMTEFATRFGSS